MVSGTMLDCHAGVGHILQRPQAHVGAVDEESVYAHSQHTQEESVLSILRYQCLLWSGPLHCHIDSSDRLLTTKLLGVQRAQEHAVMMV